MATGDDAVDLLSRLSLWCILLVLGGCNLGSCEKYASNYSCSYVENDAQYEVWYWRRIYNDDPKDNALVGMANGLRACRATAMGFANAIGEPWNDRAYICTLIKDGERMEKHRLL
jgi:hypothetical protein